MADKTHIHTKTDEKIEAKLKKDGFERKPDGTIEITVVIPWETASKVKNEIEQELVKNVQVAGFRKGQAPKNIAKEKLNPETIKEEMLKKVVGKAYNDAITKHNLTPIVSPQIHIEVFTEGTDVIFTAQTCEEPRIDLKNYKEEIKNLSAKSKIIVPGKEEKKVTLDEILDTSLKVIDIKIPEILVETEVSRLLSQLLDELKKLGLTLDQYLKSKGQDPEKLREEYKSKAERDLKLEFFLRKVANEEKITVEKEDIEKALGTIENPKEREEIMKNPYLVASIIRQQKTITYLTSL